MSDAHRLLLAFDFGLRRIGIASGNLLTRTASPLTTLSSRGGPPWPAIEAVIADWQPDLIVVGHPGEAADAALLEALDVFVTGLQSRAARPVEQVDERYTSTAAAETLRAGRGKGIYNRRLDRGRIDSHAACLIAEQWMSEALERD